MSEARPISAKKRRTLVVRRVITAPGEFDVFYPVTYAFLPVAPDTSSNAGEKSRSRKMIVARRLRAGPIQLLIVQRLLFYAIQVRV